MLIVNLLGEFGVTLDGQPVTLERRIGRMLAYLLLNLHHHNRELLAAVLWPDDDKPHLADLRGNIFRLRKALGENKDHQVRVLGTDDLRFHLLPDDLVDVLALEQTHLADADLSHLIKLADSYAPPADEVAELFSAKRLERLAERYGQVLAAVCARLQERGEARQGLFWSKKWIEHDPQSEETYIQQMKLFALLGDEDGVLNTYERCEHNKEMPASRKVREAHDRCIAQAQRVLEQGLLPPHNLPHYDTPLVGRKAELAQVAEALQNPHAPLLSLIGMGGMGKTRLAVEAARGVLRHFLDGVFLVKLDAVSNVSGLAAQIADAMGFRFYGGESSEQQLHNRLRDKHLLLVLDSFEHVLGEPDETSDPQSDVRDVVAWLDRLVDSAENVKLMITSRQRLLSPHEQVIDLLGLAVPQDADAPEARATEAVSLFERLARRRYSDDLPLADMVRICKLVQGMPLGIELAASWVRAKSCAEIAAGIERERDLAAAQDAAQSTSLRATFEYSWKQLNGAERELFMKLCLFEAGCSSAAAEAVAEATGSGLLSLADKSFVRREPSGRYVIHDLLREFGREKFGDAGLAERRGVAEERLVNYFVGFAEAQSQLGLAGYDALEPEWASLLAALRLAHARQDWETVLQLTEVLTEAWDGRSRYADALVGHKLATDAAMTLNLRPRLLRSLRWQGRMLLEQGQYSQAEAMYTHALSLAMDEEDEVEIAWVYHDQAWNAIEQGRGQDADYLLTQCVSILEEYDHEDEIAPALILIVRRCIEQGELDAADKAAERARKILEPQGQSLYLAHAYKWLSEIAQRRQNWAESEMLIDKALQISQAIKEEFAFASCQYIKARLRYKSGQNLEEGLNLAELSLKTFKQIGVKKSVAFALNWVGMFHGRLGALAKARDFLTESLMQIETLSDEASALVIENNLAEVLQSLSETEAACHHWQHALQMAHKLQHTLLDDIRKRLQVHGC